MICFEVTNRRFYRLPSAQPASLLLRQLLEFASVNELNLRVVVLDALASEA